MIHHTNDPRCPSCEEKLTDVHEKLRDWFLNFVKPNEPDCHIAWGWRGQSDQHADYMSGRSKLDWPDSKHNNMVNYQPCALALDLFFIGDDDRAYFPYTRYQSIADDTSKAGFPITWGGTFAHLKDLDHFQLNDDALKKGD